MRRARTRGLRLTALQGRRQRPDDDAHRLLIFQLRAAGLTDFEIEHPFAREIGRGYRWDVAFVKDKLAVEVDGGIWSEGAHGHPLTILRNMAKRNWAARLGWRCLAFSTAQVKKGEAIAFIYETLTGKVWSAWEGKCETAPNHRHA